MPFFPTPLARPRPASPGARLLTRLSAHVIKRSSADAIICSAGMSSKEKQMNEGMTVPVTMRALIQRINRKLRQDDHRLRTARGWFSNLGDYYVLDFKYNRIVKGRVNPDALGGVLGVLKDYEKMLVGSWSNPNTGISRQKGRDLRVNAWGKTT